MAIRVLYYKNNMTFYQSIFTDVKDVRKEKDMYAQNVKIQLKYLHFN